MSITLKLRELELVLMGIDSILGQGCEMSGGFKLDKLKDKIMEDFKKYMKKQEEFADKYAELDEKGNKIFLNQEKGIVKIKEENQNDIITLHDTEINYEFETLVIEKLKIEKVYDVTIFLAKKDIITEPK